MMRAFVILAMPTLVLNFLQCIQMIQLSVISAIAGSENRHLHEGTTLRKIPSSNLAGLLLDSRWLHAKGLLRLLYIPGSGHYIESYVHQLTSTTLGIRITCLFSSICSCDINYVNRETFCKS
ncbi:hypothetical protein KSP39_PZI020132 [Platanthera zijinensis]|uniref:Secreted protein n=1 Tax=Platanthera zijinensis TaxID=2320716 RepID=A0AAP0FWT8_9ASPA